MILVVCTDDDELRNVARNQSENDPAEFGAFYQVFKDRIDPLGQGENLFVSAHGAYKGDDGNPVIGDKGADFYVNAVDFYRNLKEEPVFPDGYKGNVYISACESSDIPRGAFSFAEVFKAQLQADHPNTRVFGQKGGVGLNIPRSNDTGWEEAQA